MAESVNFCQRNRFCDARGHVFFTTRGGNLLPEFFSLFLTQKFEPVGRPRPINSVEGRSLGIALFANPCSGTLRPPSHFRFLNPKTASVATAAAFDFHPDDDLRGRLRKLHLQHRGRFPVPARKLLLRPLFVGQQRTLLRRPLFWVLFVGGPIWWRFCYLLVTVTPKGEGEGGQH